MIRARGASRRGRLAPLAPATAESREAHAAAESLRLAAAAAARVRRAPRDVFLDAFPDAVYVQLAIQIVHGSVLSFLFMVTDQFFFPISYVNIRYV